MAKKKLRATCVVRFSERLIRGLSGLPDRAFRFPGKNRDESSHYRRQKTGTIRAEQSDAGTVTSDPPADRSRFFINQVINITGVTQ
jgi:hypothetical protein